MARKAAKRAKQAPVEAETEAGTESTAVAKKFHPGQYAALPRGDTLRMMAKAKVPGLKGFHIRVYWRELEPLRGVYDMTPIVAALKYCETNHLQLILMLIDKTFTPDNPLPPYMNTFAIPNRNGGFTAMRWHVTYIARIQTLLRAIGQHFDGHPRFEGVALQESSLGLSGSTLDRLGYTPEAYRDALIKVINSANTVMPNTRMFWYMNYLPGKQAYIAGVASGIAPGGHLMGGPDWLPDAYLLNKNVYPFYVGVKDKMNTFIAAQYDSYKHIHRTASKTKYWTPGELYDAAKARIFNEYFLWTYLAQPQLADSYCYTDAIPVIARDA